ncbi:hypothetical protein PR003_g3205 [Phytophthora rubi]|uniref:Reverse transcriptase domain-containing protein n=1 Tax=Phytophthora rubi TaxID=129364 RepID=A0A6A4G7P9_9STRA|nr:hypothetical protein PR003_g3205 [Phytophthora rubi]
MQLFCFADDCTGLLRDLRGTQRLLNLVDQYCQASVMELNKNKTVVLPFRPWGSDTDSIRESLQELGLSVVGNDDSTKRLGIYYGPKLTDAVVILQHIILPVLWYSASVCYVPKYGFQHKLEAMIVRYMKTSMTSNIVPRIWWSLPQSMGSLGLTPAETMIQGLQLHTLCQRIVAVRNTPLSSQDHEVSRRDSRWSQMGKYWHQLMFLWSKKLMQTVARNASAFNMVTMPFLDNTLVTTAT